MRALRLLVFVPVLASAGCTSTIPLPKSPSQGGAAWRQLTTKHFVTVTDLDERAAREKVEELETTYEELRATAFPRSDSGPRTTVVVFRDERERWAFRPDRGAAAEYIDHPRLDLERAPTVVMHAARYPAEEAESRRIFLHELTHAFLHHTYGGVPTWMNEGLADYLSSLRVEGDRVIIGENPMFYRLTLQVMPSVGELLGTPRATFYGEGLSDAAAREARYRYYSASWALVHFLQNGPEPIRARYQELFRRLDGGATMRDAWRATLGQVPAADFENAFRAYVLSSDLRATARPLAPRSPSPVDESRRLTDAEVHLLWARIAGEPTVARAQIDEAARLEPESAEVRYWRGCLALAERRYGEAVSELEAVTAQAPDEPRYSFAALTAVLRRDGGTTAAGSPVRSWAAALARTARTSDELTLAAMLAADDRDDAAAMRLANEAVAADPAYHRAFAGRAEVHFQAGRREEAIADQMRAIALAPETMSGAALERALERYKAPAPAPAR